MKRILSLTLASLLFAAGCMHQNPATPATAVSSHLVANLTVSVPTFARTSATRNLWLSPRTLEMPLHKSAPAEHHFEKTDTTFGDWHIAAFADSGTITESFMGGGWMSMPPEANQTHLRIALMKAGTQSDSTSAVPVLHSTVTVNIQQDGNPLSNPVLLPLFSGYGPGYGANLVVPLGMSTLTFTAQAVRPQTVWMDSANAGRQHSPMSGSCNAMVHAVSAISAKIGSSVSSDSILFEFYVQTPETLWVWDSVSGNLVETPPSVSATLFLEVRVSDLKSRGSAGPIGSTRVRCSLHTEDHTDSSATPEPYLSPVHGRNGFYYGANMRVPIPVPGTGGHGGH